MWMYRDVCGMCLCECHFECLVQLKHTLQAYD